MSIESWEQFLGERLSEKSRVVGWFLSGYEDKTYPAYTCPGDPTEAVNPLAEVLAEIRREVGVDLSAEAAALIHGVETWQSQATEYIAPGCTHWYDIAVGGSACTDCGEQLEETP